MQSQIPTWLGITSLILLAGMAIFVIFAIRKGMQVKRPPENVPPERFNF
jgi:hypothetical protein